MNEYNEEEVPQLEVPETPQEEQKQEEKPDLESIKKNYIAYITASTFGAIATLFSILYFTQKNQYETAREDLRESKKEAKEQKKHDSVIIANLRVSLDNCDDNTLEDLERKIEQAQRLKLAASSDYSKINREIEIAKANERELKEATKKVSKALNNKTR